MKSENLVEVFSGSGMEAGFVKTLLDDSGILAFLKDENVGTIAPWNASGGGAGAVKIVVPEDAFAEAKKIVDSYFKNLNRPD